MKQRHHTDAENLKHDTWRVFRIMAEFVEGFEAMAPVGKAVSIFGSARTKPSHPDYIAAQETGRLLAKSGFDVITGGGPGIMEAGNKGAFGIKSRQSVGLNITLPQEQHGNQYQTVSVDFHYFYARKVMFVKYSAAFICFPGGFGTMDEFFETLTLIQTLKVAPFPILLYRSEFWKGLISWMHGLAPDYVDPEDLLIFRTVESPAEAVAMVKEGIRKPWWKCLDSSPDKRKQLVSRMAQQGPWRATGEGTLWGMRPRVGGKVVAPRGKATQ